MGRSVSYPSAAQVVTFKSNHSEQCAICNGSGEHEDEPCEECDGRSERGRISAMSSNGGYIRNGLPADRMICPACGEIAESDSVDVGVGLIVRGNFSCVCGWEIDGPDDHGFIDMDERDFAPLPDQRLDEQRRRRLPEDRQMRMFHWHSTWLQNYSTGDIVVLALDVEEARQLVRERFDDWLKEERDWLDPSDEDDAEYIAELRRRMEADLAKEPSEDRVQLIRGGE